MSQIIPVCTNCGSDHHKFVGCHLPSYTVEESVPNAPKAEKSTDDPIEVNQPVAYHQPDNPSSLDDATASGSAGVIITDRTTYTFNFSATPVVPIMANYVNANLLCEDLRKWGSQMERWAIEFQRFATEMDELVKLPCDPHFVIDGHGFTIKMKLPTGIEFEAEVQRGLERGMNRFTERFEGLADTASGGLKIEQYSMTTQQQVIQQPALQQPAALQQPKPDQSQAPTIEESVAAGSPAPKKSRGRGGSAAGRGRGGGATGRVVKVKKEPVEKKIHMKKTPAKKDPPKKTIARNPPVKSTKAATTEVGPAVPANTGIVGHVEQAHKLDVPEKVEILVPNAQVDTNVESIDHDGALEAVIASEIV